MFWKNKNKNSNVLVMERDGTENEYLHKDFHLSMNLLLQYIYDKFGEDAVIEYLQKFTREYHGPLTRELSEGYITPLIDYFEDIYEREGSKIEIEFDSSRLRLTIPSCPAFDHIREKGQEPSKMLKYTYETIFNTICENTPFEYIQERYNEETGGGIHTFKRREQAE
jgi:hypothetical protein